MDLINKNYVTIKDLQKYLGIGYKAASEIIKKAIEIAKERDYLLPNTNKLIAPWDIVDELLKI